MFCSVPFDASREKQALINGAFLPQNEQVPDVTPVCSSGECQWPTYGSLAICSTVANLTALGNQTLLGVLRNSTSRRLEALFNSTPDTVSELSYGAAVLASVPPSFPIVIGPLANPSGALNESITQLLASDHYVAYSNMLMTNVSIHDLPGIQFLEVAFHWCTKTFSTQVSGGIASSGEVASSIRTAKPPPYSTVNFAWSEAFYPCYETRTCNQTFGGMEIDMEAPPQVEEIVGPYTIHVWTALMASAPISATMYGSVLMDVFRGFVASNGGGIAEAFASPLLGDFMAPTAPPADVQMQGVQNVVRNMAKAMTNL
jgi:hypothetical protein